MPQAIDDNAIVAAVAAAHDAMTRVSGGKNADYIPYLASVPSDLCGVAVVTADGKAHEAGDSRFEFAIESISKVPTLALVMETHGTDAVRARIGDSPTGLPFNSVMALELHGGKPLSPLVNAGAIATASLVPGDDAEARWQAILDFQSKLTGRPIALSSPGVEFRETGFWA